MTDPKPDSPSGTLCMVCGKPMVADNRKAGPEVDCCRCSDRPTDREPDGRISGSAWLPVDQPPTGEWIDRIPDAMFDRPTGADPVKIYRLTFESVAATGPGAIFYAGDGPIVRPDEVPDEFWHTVVVDNDVGRRDQYHTLVRWAATGEQLIRNVRWYEAEVATVEWVEVTS